MRRTLLIAVAVLVCLAAAWTVYWNVMASRAADWVAVWAAPATGKPWYGSFHGAETSGFPFMLRVRLADVSVTWQGHDGEAVWRGPWLVAGFRPWSLARFDIDLPPEQTVSLDDGAMLHLIAVEMSSGTAHVEIEDNRASALSLDLADVVATVEQNRPPVTASRVRTTIAAVPGDAPAWDVALRLEDARFPSPVPAPFTGEMPLLSTAFTVRGDVPDGPLAQRLAAWRDGGGVIDIHSLDLDWPPLEVAGEGSVALDRQMRPVGAFTAEVVGYREMIDAFEQLGQIPANQAAMAGGALDAMARTGEDGKKRLTVPLSVQDGHLFVGPLMVAEVPPVLPAEAGF